LVKLMASDSNVSPAGWAEDISQDILEKYNYAFLTSWKEDIISTPHEEIQV
jgi:hypothetical protein